MMKDATDIDEKRVFWRKVLIAGILILALSLLALGMLYSFGMSEALEGVSGETELEVEIAKYSARSGVISHAAKWTLPFAIFGSLVLNVARFRLRKLRQQEKEMVESLN